MNHSPVRYSQSPQLQKPRVSFVYQNQSPLVQKIESLTPIRRSEKQNKYVPSYQKVTKTALCENNILAPSQKNKTNIVQQQQTKQQSESEKPYNRELFKNQKQQVVKKYPPMSPKEKKYFPAPSFLMNKHKQVRTEHNQTEMEYYQKCSASFIGLSELCKCGKNPTHSDLKSQKKYCTKCGIQKMLSGEELKQYLSGKSQDQPEFNAISNISLILSNSNIRQPSKQMELEQLLKDIEEQKKSLTKFYDDTEQQDKQIHLYFKEKKIELKTHYQKIKAAIKQSIAEDLKQLCQLEKEQIEEWKNSRSFLAQDISRLQQIEEKIKPNLQNIVKEMNEQQYTSIINKSKLQINRLNQQNTKSQTMLTAASKITQHSGFGNMYRPQIYRMLAKQSNQETSFNTIDRSDSSIHVKTNRKKTKSQAQGILFSFQGRR